MRAHLQRTLNELNDTGLLLVEEYARTLIAVPTFTEQPTKRRPMLSVVSSTQTSTDILTPTREPYFLLDRRLEAICVSASLLKLLDVPPQALYGNAWMQVVDGPDELRVLNNKWLIAAQTHEGFTHTVRCTTGTGGIVFLFMRVVPYLHPITQQFEGFFGACRPQSFPMTLVSSQAQSA